MKKIIIAIVSFSPLVALAQYTSAPVVDQRLRVKTYVFVQCCHRCFDRLGRIVDNCQRCCLAYRYW